LALHTCPARCGARRRCGTTKSASAPCLPLRAGTLLRHSPPRQVMHALRRSRRHVVTYPAIEDMPRRSASRPPSSQHQFR
jgi:hypothetical protein